MTVFRSHPRNGQFPLVSSSRADAIAFLTVDKSIVHLVRQFHSAFAVIYCAPLIFRRFARSLHYNSRKVSTDRLCLLPIYCVYPGIMEHV